MTWRIFTFTIRDGYMGEHLVKFVNATDWVVRAMKAHADRTGEMFVMDMSTPPRVSYTDIITHASKYAAKKWADPGWVKLMEFRIHIIVSAMRVLGDDSKKVLEVEWWSQGHNDLTRQHKEMVLQGYLDKEREVLARARNALVGREAEIESQLKAQVAAAAQAEIESRLKAQVAAAAQTAGLCGSGMEHDDLAANSVNYSRRDDSVVTFPCAPVNTTVPGPRTSVTQVTTNPPDKAINAPASDIEIDQDKVDPELGSCTRNDLGYNSPEDQQSLNLVETEVRNLSTSGTSTGEIQWRTSTTQSIHHPKRFLTFWGDMWICGAGPEFPCSGSNVGLLPQDAHVGAPR
jgi:hypothetical protein